MIFSVLFAATVSAIPVKRDADLPASCQVLTTLFTQCSDRPGTVPSIYPPHCEIDGQGFVTCCAVTPDGTQTNYCEYYTSYDQEGCKVLDRTLQTECLHNGGYSLTSPTCWGSSDGSSKCCARNNDGTTTGQCVSSPGFASNTCRVLSDLTLQCVTSSGVKRTPPQCTYNNGVRKCCAYAQDGSVSRTCQAIA